MAALAQFAAGEDAPFTAPEALAPSVDSCDTLWHFATGDCNPCVTVTGLVARLGGPDFPCPE